MARCTSCSAPLAANSNRCSYCHTRSDVDLHAKLPYQLESQVTHRICPNCDKPLQTVRLKMAEPIFIERCHSCYGLFFDKGEIELLLQSAVSHVNTINVAHIDNINKDRYHKPQKIRYVKCPECQRHMNRVNFGKRSGVVVDQCIIHGIWLDNGELTHLLEWKKAGGQLLHQQHAAESAQQAQRKQNTVPGSYPSSTADKSSSFGDFMEADLISLAVGKLLDKLF